MEAGAEEGGGDGPRGPHFRGQRETRSWPAWEQHYKTIFVSRVDVTNLDTLN